MLLLAGAIGSGEYVLWPYITSQVGLALVWLTLLGVLTQYFLNMEIERYTLATGETAVTGFTRLWKPWGLLFVIMTIVPWAWPGWATGGTTTLSFALGFSEDAVPYITIGVLVLIGAILTVSPVVYQTVEKIQFFMVALIVLFVAYAAVFLLGGDGYSALARGFVEVDKIPDSVSDDRRRDLARRDRVRRGGWRAQSRAVQLGTGQGPWDGSPAAEGRLPVHRRGGAAPTTGYFFKRDEANMRRWNAWWKVADREQFTTFFVIGAITLFVFMTLTYVTVGTGDGRGELRLHQGPG